MTESRLSKKSSLDTEGVRGGTSDTCIGVVMEMVTAVSHIPGESAGTTIFEPMERIEYRKGRSRSEAIATAIAPSDWRCTMERTIRREAPELTLLP